MKDIKNINTLLAIALIITPLIIIPVPPYMDYFYLPKITFLYIILILIIGIHILAPNRQPIKLDGITIALLGYLFLASLSTIFAIDSMKALLGAGYREEGLLAVFTYAGLFLFAKTYYKFTKWHLYGFLITAFIISIYGFIQWLGLDFIPRDFIRGSEEWSHMVFATIGNPNFLGSYLVLTIPVAIYVFIITSKINAFFVLLLLLGTLIISFTRSAWLGFTSILIMFAFYFKNNLLNIKKGLLVIVIFLLTFLAIDFYHENEYSKRLATIGNSALMILRQEEGYQNVGENRVYLWLKTIELIQERPVLGYGFENMHPLFFYEYKEDMRENLGSASNFDRAHNEYLNIAFANGIPALLFYLTFLGLCLKKGWDNVKNQPHYLPILIAIIAYLLQAFFNISVVSVAFIFWIFLGILTNENVFTKKSVK